MAITRLSGGLTPADGSDPRTFPTIFNDAADDIEANAASIIANGTAITGLDTRLTTAETNITNRVVKNNRSGQYFTYTVERNGNVTAGQYWAYGNGSLVNFGPVTFNCVFVAMSIKSIGETGTLVARLNKNGSIQSSTYEVSISSATVVRNEFTSPISLSAGDHWSVECQSNSGTSSGSVVEVVGYWT